MSQTPATPSTPATPPPPASPSRLDYQQRLNQGVILHDNFNASDVDFFANPVKKVRLRPPLPGEYPDQVATISVVGLVPMVLVLRIPQGSKPRPAILAAFDKTIYQEDLLPKLGRMGDEEIFELFSGSPRSLYQSRLRWSLL